MRHTSITYKLKLSGGDIKAVQGDSGHSQANMVTEVYSHILDEDRKKNAQLLEEAFYTKKETDPDLKGNDAGTSLPEGVNPEAIIKLLSNPDVMATLKAMLKETGE